MVEPVAREFLKNFTETYESSSTADGVVGADGVKWENELSPEVSCVVHCTLSKLTACS